MVKFENMKDFKPILVLAIIFIALCIIIPSGKHGSISDANVSERMLPEQYTPRFSRDSGFYSSSFDLKITCPVKDAAIYYTLDGSIPDENAILYEGPLTVEDRTPQPNFLSALTGICPEGDYVPPDPVLKGHVIRAVAILPDGSQSEVSNRTFFVGINRKEQIGELPVISMYVDPQDLFSYDRGIYVLGKAYEEPGEEDPGTGDQGYRGNCFMRGIEWERPAAIDYLPGGFGEKGFSADLGIRIMGGDSRANMQKSFRMKCRAEYGKKNIYYGLFPGGQTKYKSFILRNGGNDYDYARFRDPMLQELVSDRAFETQRSRPVVLFIDGEYWGMYAMTEDYDGHYIENNGYGVKAENVIMIKNGEVEEGAEEDLTLFSDMVSFISENDMSDDELYGRAAEMLDMQSFADYSAFNIYINNGDSFFTNDNNWMMWRARETGKGTEKSDGKWRMMVFDTDYSTGIYEKGTDYDEDTLKDVLEGSSDGTGNTLLRSLVRNEEFRSMLIASLEDMRNVCFEKNRVDSTIAEYLSGYEKPVCDTYRRFGPEDRLWGDPAEYYRMRVGELAEWLDGRYGVFDSMIAGQFPDVGADAK
jgi:hypothetical protein